MIRPSILLLAMLPLAACASDHSSAPQAAVTSRSGGDSGLVADRAHAAYAGEAGLAPSSNSATGPVVTDETGRGAPVARLVDGKVVASPGFFAPEPAQKH